MHLAPLISDLAVILGVAGAVALLFRRIHQPLVLGYIVAGALVGPKMLHLVTDAAGVQTWADLGVIFLMFSLGLEFSFRKLAKVGLSAALTAAFEVSCMILLGYVAGTAMGWTPGESVFLGAMISISSTTIIVKALDELGLKTRRFSQMIFGVLIVEDLFAILILVALSTMAVTHVLSGLSILKAAGQLVLVVVSWFVAGYFVVPRVVKYVGRVGSNEMLTISALALCLVLVVSAAQLGYSVALGAFIMGSILAESTESHRIQDSLESLRDVFSAVFFVSVGMLLDPSAIVGNLGTILLISVVLVFGKVTFVTLGALLTGQTLRMSVQVGFGLAQIGEFSFIIAGAGVALGLASNSLYAVAVAVSLITTFTTPYMIRVSHDLVVRIEQELPRNLRILLDSYVVWAQERRADAGRRADFYRRLLKWLISGVLVTVTFVLFAELLEPKLIGRIASPGAANFAAWLAACILSSPFIWAMFNAFRKFRLGEEAKVERRRLPRGGTLLLMRVLTLIWVGILSLSFLPLKLVVLSVIVLIILFFVVFHKQIEASYAWFEYRFLSIFKVSEKSLPRMDVLRQLAPWDAHLVRIKVHPNADIVARSIGELGLRSRHGLNIVAIQRGLKTIVAPGKDEHIFPKDELLVLGTDEQLEVIRPVIERPPGLEERFKDISGYEVRPIRIELGSPLEGKSIQDSCIREAFECLVVGLERGDRRLLNPDSRTILSPGDSVWAVGRGENLDRLAQSAVAPPVAPS